MNKSNLEQYKHPIGTSFNFFWTGLRRADWVIYNEKMGKTVLIRLFQHYPIELFLV